MMVFNPDNVADIENNFDITEVDMDKYTIIEDAIPDDDDIEDYDVVEPEEEDPTVIVEPSRKKRRIRKK